MRRQSALLPDLVSWQHVEATETERGWFPDLKRTLSQAGERVAPRNRFREVRLIVAGGQRYYLKLFHHTQLKNRLKHRLSQPRARLDAEREMLVTRALRERGIAAPRPIAIGRRGGFSCYLCAELPGVPASTLLAEGRLTAAQRRAAVDFVAEIVRRGVVLPDLSADHVFVSGDETVTCGVLDLHNGRVGRPRRRDTTRMLRHLAKSVRGQAFPPTAALRCARQLVRAAHPGVEVRRVLAALPPLDLHGRYDRPGRSTIYAERNPRRHRRELARLQRVWPGQPGDRVLDVPCGAGRIQEFLERHGDATVFGADRSLAMLRQARATNPNPGRHLLATAWELPLADRAVDGVVMFRFLHHLEPDLARRTLHEAARVADRYVVVSFFHPVSTHGLQRRLRALWSRRARRRFAVTRRQLTGWMASAGFELIACRAELPYLKEFWVAAFRRRA